MKALAIAALLGLAPAAAHAVDLPVTLRDGATWTQTSVHTRTDTRDGDTRAMTATSVVKATYRKDGAVGTLRQDFISFDAEGADEKTRRALADQAKLVYPATLEVDEALVPTRVRDWDQMRDTIFQALGASLPNPRALEPAKAAFAGLDGAQAASLFKEQSLVALGQGTDLQPGKAVRYEGEAPNNLGGPPIKTSGSFRLESVDKLKKRAVVTWSQAPDSASLAESLKVTMETLLARFAPESRDELRLRYANNLTLERQETCRYEIDMATGLATTADCTVELKSGLQGQLAQRTDRWVITQTLPEYR